MRNSSMACELFRIPTHEILAQLKHRAEYGYANGLKEYSSEELLKFILTERMDSFKKE